MLNIKNEYKSSKQIVKKYNDISFSINSDDVFEKIDTLTEIFNVWTDRHEIIYMVNKVYHAEKRLRKYITKKTNGYIDRRVIKHNKWDDTIVIMDKNNNYAKKVYLVRDFLKLEEV